VRTINFAVFVVQDTYILKNKVTNSLMSKKIILTSICKSYMGSRWYTPDFYVMYCVVLVK